MHPASATDQDKVRNKIDGGDCSRTDYGLLLTCGELCLMIKPRLLQKALALINMGFHFFHLRLIEVDVSTSFNSEEPNHIENIYRYFRHPVNFYRPAPRNIVLKVVS